MGRAEVIILLSFVLVGAGAIALESAGPAAVRITAITACSLLVTLMVVGLFMRARVKKRRSLGSGPPSPGRATSNEPGNPARAASPTSPSERSDSPDRTG